MKKITQILLSSILTFFYTSYAQNYHSTTTFGSSGFENQFDRAIDSNGNYYTIGFHQGVFPFGATSTSFSGGNQDVFLTKTDSNGNPIWVKSFTGMADNAGLDITIDSANNIYLTGFFSGSGSNAFDADPGSGTYTLAQTSVFLSRDVFVIKLDTNGDFLWAKQFSNQYGTVNEDGKAIAVDSAGNVYVAGDFNVADFDPSTSDFVLCANNTGTIYTTQIDCIGDSSANSTDVFLVKLDTNGNFLWAKQLRSLMANSSKSDISDIVIDANDNLYLLGDFDESIDLDPSTTTNAIFNTSGDEDVYLTKLDTNGNYIWGHTFGSASIDFPGKVYIIDNNVFVCGSVTGTTDFDPTSSTNTFSINGLSAGFLSHFDTSGNYFNTWLIDGTDSSGNIEKIQSITKHNNNFYISGNYEGTVDFDIISTNIVNSSTAGADSDVYLLTLDATNGNYVEHFTLGGTNNETTAWADINNGSIFFSGTFKSSTVDFNPFSGIDNHNLNGQIDCFISRFTPITLATTNENIGNFGIAPNPVENYLKVHSPYTITKAVILSLDGKILKNYFLNKTTNFDVSFLASGIYIFQINTEEGFTYSKKIIKK